jgi:hypothetical protein
MKRKVNKLFIIVLAIPVVYALILTSIGFLYGRNEVTIGAIDIEDYSGKLQPVDLGFPRVDNTGPVAVLTYAYPSAFVYRKLTSKDGVERIQLNSPRKHDRDYAFAKEEISNSLYSEATKKKHLRTIYSYELISNVEKVIKFVPLDVLSLLGIIIFLGVSLARKGYVTLFLWAWYMLFLSVATLGFYSLWWRWDLSTFHEYFTFIDCIKWTLLERNIFQTEEMWIVGWWLLVFWIPGLFIVKAFLGIILNGIPSLFKDAEEILSCKSSKTGSETVLETKKGE